MTSPYGDGLVCAFDLETGASLAEEAAEVTHSGQKWLHFNLSDTRAREWLAVRAPLPERARELLLGSDARIQLEVQPGSLTAVLGDLYHDFDNDPERLGTLRLYLSATLLISGRSHPLKSVDVVRRELRRSQEPHSPLEVFQLIVERLAASLAQVVTSLGEQVDDAEDRILAGKHAGEGTALGNLRRLVARLRRLVSANRSALMSLPPALAGLYGSTERQELRAALEHLDAVWQDLELVQERARLLQEEIAARLGEATNRNLFVLSIATTTLLPITLITGIFGMNVGGLPFASSVHGFHVVMIGIAVTILLALWLLRRLGAF
jgi:zinc transporter